MARALQQQHIYAQFNKGGIGDRGRGQAVWLAERLKVSSILIVCPIADRDY